MISKSILLASGSPRRSYLLSEMDVSFRTISPDVEEIIPDGMDKHQAAEYLAQLKGETCLPHLRDNELLLAADTVVIMGNEIIGKPQTHDDAVDLLTKLSGEIHEVISGVFIANHSKSVSFSETTVVEFDELTNPEIEYYIDRYKPMDKAGAYGIQEWIGWCKIKRIEGSYSNIMGLPTRPVYQALNGF